jgi:hypothetical protein
MRITTIENFAIDLSHNMENGLGQSILGDNLIENKISDWFQMR